MQFSSPKNLFFCPLSLLYLLYSRYNISQTSIFKHFDTYQISFSHLSVGNPPSDASVSFSQCLLIQNKHKDGRYSPSYTIRFLAHLCYICNYQPASHLCNTVSYLFTINPWPSTIIFGDRDCK